MANTLNILGNKIAALAASSHPASAKQHPDLAGHIADAVRDACNIVLGKVVSFDDSRAIAATILDRINIANAQINPASAGDGAREALAFIDKFFEPWGSWKTVWWESEVSGDAAFSADNALKHVANILRRALSATPAQEGESDV